MQPTIMKALEEWKTAFDQTQERAVNALRLAMPGLGPSKPHSPCCPVTLPLNQSNGVGGGRVCVDEDFRATIELEDVPNPVIAEAVDAVFGAAWFDGADGLLEDAGPGVYNYDDESTNAEYEVVLGDNAANTGKVYVAYVPVPYAVELLDAMTTAQHRQEQEAQSS